MNTLRSLRRFAASMIAISPRRMGETAAVTLALSATEGVGLLLLVPLLALVGIDAQQGSLSRIITGLGSAFHAVGLQPTLGLVLGIYVAIVALQGLLQRREMMLNSLVQQEIVTALRQRLYRAIAGAQWSYFARTRSSDYTQVLTSEVDRVGSAAYFVIDLSVTALTSLVYIGLAFRVSPAMTGIVLGVGALLALTMRGRLDRARAQGEAVSDSSMDLYAVIAEHLGSLKLAKGYGVERRHAHAFAEQSQQMNDASLAGVRTYARFRQLLALGSAAVLAAIVYVAYTVVAVSTAQLLLLLFLFARLVPRLTGVYEKMHSLATSLPAFDLVSDVERRCLAAAEPNVVQHPIALGDRIDLEQLTFDYREDGHSPAVRDVSLSIAAGATTAIVGASGAGKSTVADLLLGLLTPTRGRIMVDGKPLGAEHLEAWRQQIGYVAQDTFLFHESVRANLLWARPEATDEELWHALEMASAATFVRAMPKGLDTIVGDRGVLVSGGERQRLALARALVRKPSLLILDEATSSLDSENEARIQEAIDRLHEQMTIVIITHRLSTIRGADRIHVLDGGRLVETGTWDELTLWRPGRFRELCRAQGIDDRPAPAKAGLRHLQAVAR